MKGFLTFFTILGLVVSAGTFAADSENTANCKLVVRTRFKDGKRRVQVIDTFADTRDECRLQAREREVASDDEIAAVKATFAWRGPAAW